MTEFGGLECFWSDLDEHPKCPHGPTLLFGKHSDGELKQFYACSACRDRQLCPFYAEKNTEFTESLMNAWKAEAKKSIQFYNHRKLFVRFNESMIINPENRAYCHRCNKLISLSERNLHKDHELKIGLTDKEMKNPTSFLKPLSNVKKEAQYLFSDKTTAEITNMMIKAGAEQILCIGSPRIHEYLVENFEHKVSSLLLDFDARFHNFFGPLNFSWYNLFNHHFFTEEGAQTYKEFLTQNGGKNMFLICDPPFGGRVEAMSQTIKTIVDQHRKWNGIKKKELELKIFFVFPYFMESIIREKSNPPGFSGGLKELRMADYKVDYDNHPLFASGSKGRKYGSPVRIFTNVSLKILELPEADGYRYCKRCEKWIYYENKHCKKCKSCSSKDGRRYKHCDVCQRCVKPTWKHCEKCERCALQNHACGIKPRITGCCFKCGSSNHIEKYCESLKNDSEESLGIESEEKQEILRNGKEIVGKKRKGLGNEEIGFDSRIKKKKGRIEGKMENSEDFLEDSGNLGKKSVKIVEFGDGKSKLKKIGQKKWKIEGKKENSDDFLEDSENLGKKSVKIVEFGDGKSKLKKIGQKKWKIEGKKDNSEDFLEDSENLEKKSVKVVEFVNGKSKLKKIGKKKGKIEGKKEDSEDFLEDSEDLGKRSGKIVGFVNEKSKLTKTGQKKRKIEGKTENSEDFLEVSEDLKKKSFKFAKFINGKSNLKKNKKKNQKIEAKIRNSKELSKNIAERVKKSKKSIINQ